MDLFAASWAALRAAVADLTDKDFEQASGCAGWLVRDLVCHLIIDAQDVLITLATPVGTAPLTADATTYWQVTNDPTTRVTTQDKVLTVADYLTAYVLEWTLHHLDLTAHLPTAPGPSSESLAHSRTALESIAGTPFPTSFTDRDALLIGTGRRTPTGRELTELSELGSLAGRLPLVFS